MSVTYETVYLYAVEGWQVKEYEVEQRVGFSTLGRHHLYITNEYGEITSSHLVYGSPGLICQRCLWLKERNINKAIDIFIKYYTDTIKREENSINNHKLLLQGLTEQKEANSQ